jgi:hypothetical protein
MKNEFVTLEQAVALKELGFREECAAHYPFDKELHLKWRYYGNMSTHPLNTIQAPLKQQAFQFFREKYNLLANVNIRTWFISKITDNDLILTKVYDELTNTYEEAENACIDKLIELVKQQDNDKD